MDADSTGVYALKYGVGMAPFINDLMRVTSPHIRRAAKRYRKPFERKDEFYWLMRSAVNYMLDIGRDCDVVIGVAVVFKSSTQLHVFKDNYKQAEQVNRKGAIVSYRLIACADDERTWLFKLTEEDLDGYRHKRA
jgi:hypothetical protein